MPNDEFAEVARQIEKTLTELKQATDPALRRSTLTRMRRLIAEADRLAGPNAATKEGPNGTAKGNR
jgi:hypothetical protein